MTRVSCLSHAVKQWTTDTTTYVLGIILVVDSLPSVTVDTAGCSQATGKQRSSKADLGQVVGELLAHQDDRPMQRLF